MKDTNEHPEVAELRNICDILPKTQMTQDICDKIKNEKNLVLKSKKVPKKK